MAAALVALALPGRAQSLDFKKEFPYRSLLDWVPGMRFQMQTTDLVFDCPLMPLKGTTFKGRDLYGPVSPDDMKLAGQVFVFQRLDAFTDQGPDNKRENGSDYVAVVFKNASGRQYAHVISTPLANFKRDEKSVGAPCLVLLDDVEKAQKVLVGRTFFVLQQLVAAASTRDNVEYLPKFVPVKITAATAGTGRKPVHLAFEYVGTGQKQEQDFVLSGTNAGRTYGSSEPSSEVFLSCFSPTDPRPAGVKEINWKAIQKGLLVKRK